MTTADFIAKTYNVESDKERRCSSVFTDHKGVVYSYGYHYPLAFNIKGLDFVNEQGYSNTTAKHINWARQAMSDDYIGVKLWREDTDALYYARTHRDKLQIVKQALERERKTIADTMVSKKRKDTAIYRDLFHQLNSVDHSLRTVSEALK